MLPRNAEHSKTYPANKIKLADNCINLLRRRGPLLNYCRLADNIVIITGYQNTKSVYEG